MIKKDKQDDKLLNTVSKDKNVYQLNNEDRSKVENISYEYMVNFYRQPLLAAQQQKQKSELKKMMKQSLKHFQTSQAVFRKIKKKQEEKIDQEQNFQQLMHLDSFNIQEMQNRQNSKQNSRQNLDSQRTTRKNSSNTNSPNKIANFEFNNNQQKQGNQGGHYKSLSSTTGFQNISKQLQNNDQDDLAGILRKNFKNKSQKSVQLQEIKGQVKIPNLNLNNLDSGIGENTQRSNQTANSNVQNMKQFQKNFDKIISKSAKICKQIIPDIKALTKMHDNINKDFDSKKYKEQLYTKSENYIKSKKEFLEKMYPDQHLQIAGDDQDDYNNFMGFKSQRGGSKYYNEQVESRFLYCKRKEALDLKKQEVNKKKEAIIQERLKLKEKQDKELIKKKLQQKQLLREKKEKEKQFLLEQQMKQQKEEFEKEQQLLRQHTKQHLQQQKQEKKSNNNSYNESYSDYSQSQNKMHSSKQSQIYEYYDKQIEGDVISPNKSKITEENEERDQFQEEISDFQQQQEKSLSQVKQHKRHQSMGILGLQGLQINQDNNNEISKVSFNSPKATYGKSEASTQLCSINEIGSDFQSKSWMKNNTNSVKNQEKQGFSGFSSHQESFANSFIKQLSQRDSPTKPKTTFEILQKQLSGRKQNDENIDQINENNEKEDFYDDQQNQESPSKLKISANIVKMSAFSQMLQMRKQSFRQSIDLGVKPKKFNNPFKIPNIAEILKQKKQEKEDQDILSTQNDDDYFDSDDEVDYRLILARDMIRHAIKMRDPAYLTKEKNETMESMVPFDIDSKKKEMQVQFELQQREEKRKQKKAQLKSGLTSKKDKKHKNKQNQPNSENQSEIDSQASFNMFLEQLKIYDQEDLLEDFEQEEFREILKEETDKIDAFFKSKLRSVNIRYNRIPTQLAEQMLKEYEVEQQKLRRKRRREARLARKNKIVLTKEQEENLKYKKALKQMEHNRKLFEFNQKQIKNNKKQQYRNQLISQFFKHLYADKFMSQDDLFLREQQIDQHVKELVDKNKSNIDYIKGLKKKFNETFIPLFSNKDDVFTIENPLYNNNLAIKKLQLQGFQTKKKNRRQSTKISSSPSKQQVNQKLSQTAYNDNSNSQIQQKNQFSLDISKAQTARENFKQSKNNSQTNSHRKLVKQIDVNQQYNTISNFNTSMNNPLVDMPDSNRLSQISFKNNDGEFNNEVKLFNNGNKKKLVIETNNNNFKSNQTSAQISKISSLNNQ